jgi:hypothetical protein
MGFKTMGDSTKARISMPEDPEVAYSGRGLLELFIILNTGIPIEANVGKD